MNTILMHDRKKNIILTLLCVVGYIVLLLFLQAIVPGDPGWLAEKKMTLCGAGLFAVSVLLHNFSKRYIAYFVTFILLYVSVVVLETYVGMTVNGIEIKRTACIATMIFAALAGIADFAIFVPNKISRIALRLVFSILLFLSIVYPLVFWGYYAVSGQFISADTVLAVCQTNISEALSYLRMQHPIFPIMILCGLFAIGYISCKNVIPPPDESVRKICIGYLACFSFSVVSFFGFPVIMDCQVGALITETKKELDNYKIYAQKSKERETKLAGMDVRLAQKEPGIYLLIIGESETRDHMSVYGYPHKTTPWLEAETEKPGTLLFQNAYSNHTHTSPALTYALTEKNQYNKMKMVDAFSIIEMAKAAGYKTYWISNQQRWGVYETPVTRIIISADKQVWCNNKSGIGYKSFYYDGNIAQYTPDLTNVSHALVVVHLMGCHGAYVDRYPPEYAMKTSDDEQVRTYDGAVHYNDEALRQLTEMVSHYPQFKGWIYFSDHGEDPENHFSHDSSNFTWQMARIPLIMHFSDSFVAENPEIYETLSAHRESYWTNDLLYNLMLSVLGIENAPHREEHLDLASPSYDRAKENLMTLHGKKHISEAP